MSSPVSRPSSPLTIPDDSVNTQGAGAPLAAPSPRGPRSSPSQKLQTDSLRVMVPAKPLSIYLSSHSPAFAAASPVKPPASSHATQKLPFNVKKSYGSSADAVFTSYQERQGKIQKSFQSINEHLKEFEGQTQGKKTSGEIGFLQGRIAALKEELNGFETLITEQINFLKRYADEEYEIVQRLKNIVGTLQAHLSSSIARLTHTNSKIFFVAYLDNEKNIQAQTVHFRSILANASLEIATSKTPQQIAQLRASLVQLKKVLAMFEELINKQILLIETIASDPHRRQNWAGYQQTLKDLKLLGPTLYQNWKAQMRDLQEKETEVQLFDPSETEKVEDEHIFDLGMDDEETIGQELPKVWSTQVNDINGHLLEALNEGVDSLAARTFREKLEVFTKALNEVSPSERAKEPKVYVELDSYHEMFQLDAKLLPEKAAKQQRTNAYRKLCNTLCLDIEGMVEKYTTEMKPKKPGTFFYQALPYDHLVHTQRAIFEKMDRVRLVCKTSEDIDEDAAAEEITNLKSKLGLLRELHQSIRLERAKKSPQGTTGAGAPSQSRPVSPTNTPSLSKEPTIEGPTESQEPQTSEGPQAAAAQPSRSRKRKEPEASPKIPAAAQKDAKRSVWEIAQKFLPKKKGSPKALKEPVEKS